MATMNRLAELRRAQGLTQEALAKRVGASRRAVQGWEKEGHVPIPIYREKIARALKVSVDELGLE